MRKLVLILALGIMPAIAVAQSTQPANKPAVDYGELAKQFGGVAQSTKRPNKSAETQSASKPLAPLTLDFSKGQPIPAGATIGPPIGSSTADSPHAPPPGVRQIALAIDPTGKIAMLTLDTMYGASLSTPADVVCSSAISVASCNLAKTILGRVPMDVVIEVLSPTEYLTQIKSAMDSFLLDTKDGTGMECRKLEDGTDGPCSIDQFGILSPPFLLEGTSAFFFAHPGSHWINRVLVLASGTYADDSETFCFVQGYLEASRTVNISESNADLMIEGNLESEKDEIFAAYKKLAAQYNALLSAVPSVPPQFTPIPTQLHCTTTSSPVIGDSKLFPPTITTNCY